MCGIAGVIEFGQNLDRQEMITQMIGHLHHRGPDAAGMYLNGPVALGHARLSIIDLSGGNQPIHNEAKNLWVIYNGEVFNYPELRKELIEKGHRFYTQSDTEILVHAYEEYGSKMLHRLNGQFAFAIWDQKTQRLFMARDRVGIRPLYYHHNGNYFSFASEIKALFADSRISRDLNPQTIGDIFTCWAPMGEQTVFNSIQQIPPGCYAYFTEQGLKIKRYWEPEFEKSDPWQSPLEDWVEEFHALLLDATRIRLRADVPVGAYLSGGIDSTFTTSLVRNNFNNALRTFSVTFSDANFNEADYQAKAIASLKTQHSDICCTEADIGKNFPAVIWHTEVPILRTAPAPLFQLSKLVRENNFKVVLTGEGADEILAGYNIFKEDRLRRFWAKNPDSKMRPMLLEKLYPYIFSKEDGKAKTYLQNFFKKSLSNTDSPVFSHLVRWQNANSLKGFFVQEIAAEASLDNFISRYEHMLPEKFNSWESLSKAQYTEMTIFLSNYLLSSQGDRMAMAHSVEGRYPFLDYRVIEFANRLPARFKLNGLTEKFILKQAARNHVPKEVIQRSKQPYRAPISRCFFGSDAPEYIDEMFSVENLNQAGYFDPAKVERLVKKCRQNKGELLSERENMAVVGILSVQLLHEQFVRNFPTKPIKLHANVTKEK
ncbi:MAG: asparagine synthase (glutamine-hydrolyzing) [Desulfobacteraceae bacterium]|jgi:asparagine synthase (glutamine-hydrolysing)